MTNTQPLPRCAECGKPVVVKNGQIERHLRGDNGKRCKSTRLANCERTWK